MRSLPQADYMLWIMVSTIGLMQALASYYGWRGLSFFRRRPLVGYVWAGILIPASYVWFFAQENRNTPGLEGWQLFSRFVVGVAAGLIVVLIVSSFLNRDMPAPASPTDNDSGVDVLRHQPYARALLGAARRALSRGDG